MRLYLSRRFDIMRRCIPPFKYIMLSAAVMLLISSCATLSGSGVGRVKEYVVESDRLPGSFDGFRVAFVSDLHYPSLFNARRLGKLVKRLEAIAPDALLLGGDYVTDNDSIDALFSSLASVEPPFGIFAVLGNHERRNEEFIAHSMKEHGIVLLADTVMPVSRDNDTIFLAGVYDSFRYDSLAVQPSETLPDSLFTILLCHTPDYAERSGSTADLVLSGHTHGGQVTLFGMYTPVKNSAYGTRFLRGLNRTSSGSTIITTNGVGTSRRKVRFCVPSELVYVTLKKR